MVAVITSFNDFDQDLVRKKSGNSQHSRINWSWFTWYRCQCSQLEPKKQHFQISIRPLNTRTFRLNAEFLWTPWCSVGKQITYLHYILVDVVEQKRTIAVRLCLTGINRFHFIDFFPTVFPWGRCHRLISLWSTDQDCSTLFLFLT